jgi:hypothetical protein
MNQYIKDLWAAFNLVEDKYHTNKYYGALDKTGERREYDQYVERVFAYELYYQFRTIIHNNPSRYGNLMLNGETRKNELKKTLINKNYIFPDMVLHKDQKDKSEENQILFIEIKTSKNVTVDDDIDKLYTSVTDCLNFQNAVYICVNSDTGDLRKSIKAYFYSDTHENPKKQVIAGLNLKFLSKMWLLTSQGIFNFSEINKNG